MFIRANNPTNYKRFNSTLRRGNVIVLYYADWCPHCVMMKPAWNNFIKDCKSNNVNINIAEVESQHIPNIKTSGDAEGFPTIKYYNNLQNNIPYEGDRTSTAFLEFAKKQSNKFNNSNKSKGTKKRVSKQNLNSIVEENNGYETDNELTLQANNVKPKKRTKKLRKHRNTKKNMKDKK